MLGQYESPDHQISTKSRKLCLTKAMSEDKKSIPKPTIPKPTIRDTPPVSPPLVSVDDTEPPKVPEASEEETSTPDPVPNPNGVEIDLVKRFLGVFVDSIVAAVIASVVGSITDSSILYYLVFGVVMLTRDSLPFLEGQSIGKKVMKTKAVKEDGSSLAGDWMTGGTRNILLAIPVAGIVECFIILTRSGRPGAGMRLGDEWAKTKVISVD